MKIKHYSLKLFHIHDAPTVAAERVKRGLSPIDVFAVELVAPEKGGAKISSTDLRAQLAEKRGK